MSSPVSEARKLHLPFIVGVLNPSMPRSTMTPWIRPSSFFAHTTANCANGAFEIHILAPLRMMSSPSSL